MKPAAFVELFGREKASAILRCDDQEVAAEAMAAAIRGGFRVVEFTMTVPGVLDLIRDFSGRDDVVVGAGTVLTVQQAERVVEAGGRFLVSPVTDEAVIRKAGELGVAMMPGTHTPTEMMVAHNAGAQLMKLFPAPGIGPAFVRSVLGPLPFLKIVPTNGVDEANCQQWLAAGVWAMGWVAPLFAAEDLAGRRFDAIEERARRILGRVRGDTPVGPPLRPA